MSAPDGPGGHGGPGKTISLGVDESNALREKLGLKPLAENGGAAGEVGSWDEATAVGNLKKYREDKEDAARKKEMKQKILHSREERKLAKAFGGKGLADEWTEETDNIGSFLSAMDALKTKKVMAEQRYDEEEEEALAAVPSKATKPARGYTSADIAGMAVDHDVASFEAGTTQILTLKDESILGSGATDGDAIGPRLVSSDVAYRERAQKAVETRQRGTKYNPYADEEHEGGLRPPGQEKKLLGKYDEVIDSAGASKSFTLDATGSRQKEKVSEEVAGRLRAETAAIERREIAEYYTKDEQVKFSKKKRKKRKGAARSKVEDQDDQQAAADKAAQEVLEDAMRGEGAEGADDVDHKSRSRKRGRATLQVRTANAVQAPSDGAIVASSTKQRKIAPKTMVKAPLAVEEDDDDEYTLEERQEELVVGVEIEEDDELASMLARTKARSLMRQQLTAQQQAAALEAEAEALEGTNTMDADDANESAGRGVMEISSTDGFFRGIAREGDAHAAAPSKTGGDDMEVDGDEPAEDGVEATTAAETEAHADGDDADKSKTPAMMSEPVAARGMAAAWDVAVSRGLVKKAKIHEKKGTLNAIALSVGKSKKIKSSRSGPLDVEGYDGEAKLSYKDEFGNEQTAREAWKSLNHIFHGNGNKRNVRERKLNKQMRAEKRERMPMNDTPTGMVATVRSLAIQSGQAHVVLDGSSAGVSLHQTLKKAKSIKKVK